MPANNSSTRSVNKNRLHDGSSSAEPFTWCPNSMNAIRRIYDTLSLWLERLYTLGGFLAALALVLILIIMVLQTLARWFGFSFPGSTNYAGYCMAAATFFALAYAFGHGAHIRVNLLLQHLSGFALKVLNFWILIISTLLAWYFAYYAVDAIFVSRMINDISQGQDATPIWIPQLAMGTGAVLFAIAVTDHLIHLCLYGKPKMKDQHSE